MCVPGLLVTSVCVCHPLSLQDVTLIVYCCFFVGMLVYKDEKLYTQDTLFTIIINHLFPPLQWAPQGQNQSHHRRSHGNGWEDRSS